MKLTKWFDGRKFVPAHVGVYETDYDKRVAFVSFQYWNGNQWNAQTYSIDEAIQTRFASLQQNPNWRGLAENPNDDQKV